MKFLSNCLRNLKDWMKSWNLEIEKSNRSTKSKDFLWIDNDHLIKNNRQPSTLSNLSPKKSSVRNCQTPSSIFCSKTAILSLTGYTARRQVLIEAYVLICIKNKQKEKRERASEDDVSAPVLYFSLGVSIESVHIAWCPLHGAHCMLNIARWIRYTMSTPHQWQRPCRRF